MNPQHQIQLEDVQKKLSVFKKHLDLLARCTGESKNVEKNEVVSAVNELQSLVEWASQQPELGSVSAVLLVKLQELNQIRENLEKTSTPADEHSVPEVNDGEETTVPEKSENYSTDLEYISDIVTANLCDNNGENTIEEDSLSVDKDSLCDYSVSIEDPNLANAESPESIEDTNVDIIPSDDKIDEVDNVAEKDNSEHIDEKDNSEHIDEKDNSEQIDEKESTTNIEEVSQEHSEVQRASQEIKTEDLELQSGAPEIRSPTLFRSDVIIIETDEDDKPIESAIDSKDTNDPLDVCMYAIRNLYESLRVKENELLKLSAMQNDQKHIEALQAVIIDFHKDITNLNSELEKSRKENMLLKEQVLELEEAENDARLEAQKLEQKLVFLQEKDSHSQAELTQLKQSLKKSSEALAEKEVQEKELRSQIKYMDTLVQKYEDQIKSMEAKETAASQNVETKPESELKEDAEKLEKPLTCNKGTQTYQPSQIKIKCNGEGANNNIDNNNENGNTDLNICQCAQAPEELKEVINEKKVTDMNVSICSIPPTSANETTKSAEQAEFVNIENIENISQKELLLKRLHKLIDEDVNLQQQIHYVDEINLAMWKKLQNLDNHIGECKRQNINETNPVIAETEVKESNYGKSDAGTQETSNISTNKNIPEENLNFLDQNEQYIQERLTKLEEINASFEKDLKIRENLCKEKEKKYEEWVETEKRIMEDLNRLAEERDWITNQVTNLKRETETRENHISELEKGLTAIKEKNQKEISKIKEDQEAMTEPLNLKVNQMLTKEKEILRMITNLKLQKNRSQSKNELERLKCSYIELQLELSQAREEIRKIEEHFKIQHDQCRSKHLLEESHRSSEVERLRNENSRCDKMKNNLQKNEKDLINALEKQEKYLQQAREDYKQNLEEKEEEHRSVETELKSQLRQIEEGTAIATTVLMGERMKVEKELQKNIEDLKAKEEIYKAKIAELERDVTYLHEELHNMADDSEMKNGVQQLQETSADEAPEKIIEVPFSKAEDLNAKTRSSPQSEIIEVHLNSFEEKVLEKPCLTVKAENLDDNDAKDSIVLEEVVEENVDELRAQVRELQSHIEKMSVEVCDMPPVQPAKPITTSSLKIQKVEDIDYAEVDECCLDAWKKSLQNAPTSKDSACNNQGFYGGNYSAGSKDDLKNKKVPAEESIEENDYDEVLPRPTNFHVVQQVGSDTLLVGWSYVNPSVLDGFEVYLDDQVHERIYIPDRTKALISGLNLKKPIRLSICALSRYGQMSEPAVLDLLSPQEINANYYEDEDDEYRELEDPMKRNQRPYSMEW